jgi:tetratricopeptide (TPR) repeat protein
MKPLSPLRPQRSSIQGLFLLGLGLLAASMFIGTGCNSPRALAKRGAKMEEAGMMDQAANFYYTALQKDRNHLPSLSGMERTGQAVLMDRLADFDAAVLENNRAAAVKAYESADAYFKKVEGVGVRLNFPETKRMLFAQVKNAHMDDLYNRGLGYLEAENFTSAQVDFDEIVRLDPTYRDAKQMADVSYCEPRYRRGKSALAEKRYRTAHTHFSECVNRKADYKDAAALRTQALNEGIFTIALVPFTNGSDRPNMEAKVRSYVQQELTQSQDPFLKVVDRDNQELILREQRLALSGAFDDRTAVEVGNLLGARALMKGTVVDCSVSQSQLKSEARQGFESYQVEKVNSEGKKYYETAYRSVTYYEYVQNRRVNLTFNLVLVSLETGATIASKMIQQTEEDEVHYVRYNGNAKNLFPMNVSGNVDRSGKARLEGMLTARQELIDEPTLVNNASKKAATSIRQALEQELLTLVP